MVCGVALFSLYSDFCPPTISVRANGYMLAHVCMNISPFCLHACYFHEGVGCLLTRMSHYGGISPFRLGNSLSIN